MSDSATGLEQSLIRATDATQRKRKPKRRRSAAPTQRKRKPTRRRSAAPAENQQVRLLHLSEPLWRRCPRRARLPDNGQRGKLKPTGTVDMPPESSHVTRRWPRKLRSGAIDIPSESAAVDYAPVAPPSPADSTESGSDYDPFRSPGGSTESGSDYDPFRSLSPAAHNAYSLVSSPSPVASRISGVTFPNRSV